VKNKLAKMCPLRLGKTKDEARARRAQRTRCPGAGAQLLLLHGRLAGLDASEQTTEKATHQETDEYYV
jgi:hypothetical protein